MVAYALMASGALTLALAASAAAATIEVDTTTDESEALPVSGCALREAIVAANTDTAFGECSVGIGPDTITFDPAVFQPGGAVEVIDLTLGELDVNSDVEIQGPGRGELEVTNTDAISRIVDIPGVGHEVRISGLAITSGTLEGDGGVLGGAGIRNNDSELTLVDVELRDNTVTVHGNPAGIDAGAQGGAIYSGNDLTIESSIIEGNHVFADNSHVAVNNVFARGGAIFHENGFLDIGNSRIADNTATIDESADTDAPDEAVGAGIFASTDVAVEQTTISGNSASATSTTGSVSAKGAGIRLAGTDSRIELSTIEGNSAVGSGAVDTELRGAGVLIIGAPMTVTSSTIAGNGDATVDMEGANLFAEGAGGATVTNTIVAEPVGLTEPGTSNCDNAIVSGGFNVDHDPGALTSSCNFTDATDLPDPSEIPDGTDPLLGALDDNGGLGQTMLPQPGSPVIDKGSSADQNVADEDQRELTRPAQFATISNPATGDGSDIGAVEVQIAPPTFTGTTPVSPNVDDTPNVLGSAVAESTIAPSVRLFTNPSCTAATGNPASPAVFASPGIVAGPLPHSATTSFHGTVTSVYGSSHCSTGAFPNTISYTNTLVDPTPPVLTPPPDLTPQTPTTKCKKGFVKKKGKCTKKKRKKKG